MTRVARGEMVHPSVTGLDALRVADPVTVPIDGLPPVPLGLIWRTAAEDAKIRTLAQVALGKGPGPVPHALRNHPAAATIGPGYCCDQRFSIDRPIPCLVAGRHRPRPVLADTARDQEEDHHDCCHYPATGTITAHTYEPAACDEAAAGPALNRIHVEESFSGDIEGTGVGNRRAGRPAGQRRVPGQPWARTPSYPRLLVRVSRSRAGKVTRSPPLPQ